MNVMLERNSFVVPATMMLVNATASINSMGSDANMSVARSTMVWTAMARGRVRCIQLLMVRVKSLNSGLALITGIESQKQDCHGMKRRILPVKHLKDMASVIVTRGMKGQRVRTRSVQRSTRLSVQDMDTVTKAQDCATVMLVTLDMIALKVMVKRLTLRPFGKLLLVSKSFL